MRKTFQYRPVFLRGAYSSSRSPHSLLAYSSFGKTFPLEVYQFSPETRTISSIRLRQSIGYKRSELSFGYTNYQLEIQDGMRFYFSTDGFLDQRGGSKGLSLGQRRFSELLKAQHEYIFPEQYNNLWQAFIE